ncbi:tigger transposable element-derived protein 1-like [Erythrolamprus reginae]|uniref:tigger transposable element-derived protein 1-like n=1 Tax=Erythrolamprus reginae TaxID=121349 RepID=UPI00396C4370
MKASKTKKNKYFSQQWKLLCPCGVQECRKKSIALDTNTIRTKAQQLYNRLADTEGGNADEGNPDEGADDSEDPQPSTSSASSAPATFTASRGWFEKFQRRYGLKSVSLHGEAASADTGAAENFVQRTFKDLIAEGGYLPEQVFNMDETGPVLEEDAFTDFLDAR